MKSIILGLYTLAQWAQRAKQIVIDKIRGKK
jgi:hypothetical protein